MTTPKTTDALEARAAELRKVLDAPTPQQQAAAELAAVEQQIVARREARGKAEAERRLTEIEREHAAAADELELAEEDLVVKARAYAQGKARVNGAFRATVERRAEDNAVRDRFGIAGTLPAVAPPVTRRRCREATAAVMAEGFVEHGHVHTAVERCDHGLRTRRTYREIAGTPGAEIIAAVGLRPWPELTQKQLEILAERAAGEHRDEEVGGRLAAVAPAELARLTERKFGRTAKL